MTSIPTILKTIEKDRAQGTLAQHVAQLGDEPLVIVVHGKPVAALVPLHGVDLESLAVGTHPDFIEILARSRASHRAGKSKTHEDLWKELDEHP